MLVAASEKGVTPRLVSGFVPETSVAVEAEIGEPSDPDGVHSWA